MPNIDIIYFDAGGGHRATANAIKEQLSGWKVNLINLREVLDPIDPINKYLGIKIENFYNGYIGTGWTYGSNFMLRTLQFAIQTLASRLEEQVFKFWLTRKPDLIISVIPNFNQSIYNGIRVANKVPYITVMCDLADAPPHFWMEQQDQYIVCGSDKAWHQAINIGYRDDKIKLLSGMIVNPKFYGRKNIKKIPLLTGLVSYGGEGSNKILDIAKMIDKSWLKDNLHMIFICGKNESLVSKLLQEKFKYKYDVHGFTDQLPTLMEQSDFFIGKPGPGSINEALVEQLPVLVEDSWATMIQEKYNVEWIVERGFGDKTKIGDIDKFDHFITNLKFYKDNIKRNFKNNAVFEIPQILTDILNKEKRI